MAADLLMFSACLCKIKHHDIHIPVIIWLQRLRKIIKQWYLKLLVGLAIGPSCNSEV